MSAPPVTVFFHPRQLDHRPVYEWAFGDKLAHPETSGRAENILGALNAEPTGFTVRTPTEIPEALLRTVHDPRLSTVYRSACSSVEAGATYYPSVFPKRHQNKPDPTNLNQSGFFCFDSGTPLTSLTWEAAAWSAASALEAARIVQKGEARVAYSLSRPPGHHASRDLFGGYCYFNNAAVAATRFEGRGKLAILDIDFHHGNGTQAMFYRDPNVLFISIHGDPATFYPYFSGYASERGAGEGEGFTMNLPLPTGTDGQEYVGVLERVVIPALRTFNPAALIVSAGFDTYRDDPIGRFTLDTDDFARVGSVLGRLALPTVVVQEGGYRVDALGRNVVSFLRGMSER